MYYVSDFETSEDDKGTFVWLWCIYTSDNILKGSTIQEFVNTLLQLPFPRGTKMYFHNLAFDGSFLLNELFRQGFKYAERKNLKTKGQFNTFIDNMGEWYNIRLKNNKKQTIVIADSLKLLPFSVRQIAKAFNLDGKGVIVYDLKRKRNYQPTQKEIEYVINDCKIVYDALDIMFKKGGNKLTIGSNCMQGYKNIITHKQYKKLFPNLDIPFDGWDITNDFYTSIDAFCRKGYKGAICWVAPEKESKIIHEGVVYDVNSLYPYVMYTYDYPYGIPTYNIGQPENNKKLNFVHVWIKFDLKVNGVPCIIERNTRFKNVNSWVKTSEGNFYEYVFTDVDLELIQKNYICEIKYIDYLAFKRGKNLFKQYIDGWTEIKIKASKENNQGMRTLAKLYLNNLYGKFGQNTKTAVKIPEFIGDSLGFKIGYTEGSSTSFVPIAAYCTAYARRETINAIMSNRERFCYCDTDSIHLEGLEDAKGITIDASVLGAWKLEGTFMEAKFVRQKTYIEKYPSKPTFSPKITTTTTDLIYEDDIFALIDYKYFDYNYKVVCAGFKKEVYNTTDKKVYGRDYYYTQIIGYDLEGFKSGMVIKDGKTIKKQVPGGVVIRNTDFTMR